MLTKQNKKEVVAKLAKGIKDANSAVFVNFHGLGVKDAEALRRALRAEKVTYTVARKSLIERALGESAVLGEKPEFTGELAVAWGDDLLAPARGVYEFQKKLEGKVSILGGIFEGNYKSAGEMVAIASIPPVDTLRGMFVNIVNSPIQRFVIALNQVAEKKG